MLNSIFLLYNKMLPLIFHRFNQTFISIFHHFDQTPLQSSIVSTKRSCLSSFVSA